MAVRRGVPPYLRGGSGGRRGVVLDRLSLRRPRCDGPAGGRSESPGAAAGTYVYPAGPAAGNGADIFRVAIGLTETHTWWRVDWNTLVDATVPIALFTFDTDRGRAASADWPAGAGCVRRASTWPCWCRAAAPG
ncbi:hypothetical protein BZL30_4429 [Mycobacterium kansasii]|uniref:Uncharacterized protein n=1 Tax=Mycobacterium kansasii TaxID=1768 RepID=A0A1V3X3X6_MYCKA|nr:hypothetical protein BZL30_4429 [Mycobacterium kansasii]